LQSKVKPHDCTPYKSASFDGNHFFTYNKPENSFEAWPFDTEFNVIINVAVSGNWGGVQGIDDAIFTFGYVRLYNNGFFKV